eukprot:TRINITY_DN5461_c0_g1_i4.p1 TRINITY_DN5461_c0_g1~~TRINITY_DN5461_c0_g1_i4.p1  ORF type:complete len:642 (+),score=209.80 TRINITY_DN5461_c0_g1_i4:208-1926(+)
MDLGGFDAAAARREGLARAEREYRTDPLEGWDHPDRKIVAEVCEQADTGDGRPGVPDERHVCRQRGRALSKDLQKFNRQVFTRSDVDEMIELANKKAESSFLVWVRVEKGKAVDYRAVGHLLDDDKAIGVQSLLHHIGLVAMVQKLGGFAKSQTFEYVTTVYDKCDGSPLLANGIAPADTLSYLPILGYSRHAECPANIVVPTVPWANWYTEPLTIPWERLREPAIFRASWYRDKRAHVAMASAAGLLDGVDAKVRCRPNAAEACDRLLTDLKKKHGLPADLNLSRACNLSALCSQGNYEQRSHKYMIAVDGIGAVDRTYFYMKESGVVVEVGTEFEQFFTDDVINFVHYVTLDREVERTVPQINAALAWLRSHDEEGRDIAETSTAYAQRHLTTRASARYFQLYAALWASRWNDSESNRPLPHIEQGPRLTEAAKQRGRREVGGPFGCSTMEQHYRDFLHVHPPDYIRWLWPACGYFALTLRHLDRGAATFAELDNDHGVLPVGHPSAPPQHRSTYTAHSAGDTASSPVSVTPVVPCTLQSNSPHPLTVAVIVSAVVLAVRHLANRIRCPY